MSRARLAEVQLPEFGVPAVTPELPAELYSARLERLRARMSQAGLNAW